MDTSLIRVSKKNKEIIQSLMVHWFLSKEDDVIENLLDLVPKEERIASVESAIKKKNEWLHKVKDEME